MLRTRWVRILALAAIFLLLATITGPGPPPPPQGPGEAMLTIAPVALDAAAPARRRVGALNFLGGWSLSSADERFGGISGMHVEDGRIVAISDVGMLMRFAVPGTAATAGVRFDPLVEGPGPRTRKSNRDTEAMAISGGRLWAAFERHNAIWRYDLASLRALSSARPAPMRRWGGNRGPEALVRLADGRFLAFAEGADDGAAFSPAVLFGGDASVPDTPAAPLRYRRPSGFRATDAALLPDGRILILNRRFRLFEGWSARLVAADVRRGGTIEGREIAALVAPLVTENMEALAVTREGGRTIVWIASDDNFSPLQRTLLLKFELAE
jgi:hypothetical protein